MDLYSYLTPPALSTWNPVKELKAQWWHLSQRRRGLQWNPVKELKDDPDAAAELHILNAMWNPVKELKVICAGLYNHTRYQWNPVKELKVDTPAI